MQYAMPKKTNAIQDLRSQSLPEWCNLVSTAIGKIKDLEQEVSYDAAVKFARDMITALKETTTNFAERSFVAKLAPHINPYDLGYNKF
jgi:hypothetical protein